MLAQLAVDAVETGPAAPALQAGHRKRDGLCILVHHRAPLFILAHSLATATCLGIGPQEIRIQLQLNAN